MQLVERHYNRGNAEIIRLCTTAKELYNRCNYLMRKSWFEHKFPMPDINVLNNATKELECYHNLHNTKTAKQTIRKVINDWSNFRKALHAYKIDPSKFVSKPKPPNYKNKLAQIVFYNETIKAKPIKEGILTPTNRCFSIPSTKKFKRGVITPKTFGFIIEVSYETNEQEQKSIPVETKPKKKLDKDKVCCIDIGLNNLCAITSDQHAPLLVNGRIVKSFNQWYNKNPSKSRLRKRYFRLENYFHHVSKMIVFNCLKYGIGKIIIGKNKGWKQEINLGSKTNQAFCFVPVRLLLEKIQYKAKMEGIEVVFTEEAYTSKASFLDRDALPEYGSCETEPIFSGKRIKRGLYRSSTGRILNADINGSCNIGRKVIQNSDLIARLDRSLAARPVVINPLKA